MDPRPPALLAALVLAPPAAAAEEPGRAPGAQAVNPAPLRQVVFEGGNEDDQRLALAALGLPPGKPVDPARFQEALAAIRLLDRFQSVDGRLEPRARGGMVAVLKLVPLLALESRTLEGDPLPKPLRKLVDKAVDLGVRMGPRRLEALRKDLEQQIQEQGYPTASVTATLEQAGKRLRLRFALGDPAKVTDVQVRGNLGPYQAETLIKVAKLKPGTTLWVPNFPRQVIRRIRQRFVKDHRYEGRVDVEWSSENGGIAVLDVDPGPRVDLRSEGYSFGYLLGRPSLKDLVPLARAERFSPDLLDEGDRRLVKYFRDKGYLDCKVVHERKVAGGSGEVPEQVELVYRIDRGPKYKLKDLRFEGNKSLPTAELHRDVKLPFHWGVGSVKPTPEVMAGLETQVENLYLQRGFPDVVVRRKAESLPGGRMNLVLTVREGRPRTLQSLVLELPRLPEIDPLKVGESLPLAIADKPIPVEAPQGPGAPQGRRYRSDRRALQGMTGLLELLPDLDGAARVRFTPDRPIPFVKGDLALVVFELRQRLSSLGARNPVIRPLFEDAPEGILFRLVVPPQPFFQVKRTVVEGLDRTRAEAVLQGLAVEPGDPLDPQLLAQTQVQVGSLGVFQRVDLGSLDELPGPEGEAWQPGDLSLKMKEKSRWVFTEGFGYESSQGYHLTANAQRLNVGGMGRTLDMGFQAGQETIASKWLRETFPARDENRHSTDNYTVAYTDPNFLPGSLAWLIRNRINFRSEVSYIKEHQTTYTAFRRRWLNSFEWKVGSFEALRLGHRWERTSVEPGLEGILPADLAVTAQVPLAGVNISAPFIQFTRDTRDNPLDPTRGRLLSSRLELATQLLGTSRNASFVKLDLRHQWNFPLGFRAEHGVVVATARVGLAKPTARTAQDLPVSERFFGGGPYTVRGVEPDLLGPVGHVPFRDPATGQKQQIGTDANGQPVYRTQPIAVGGQGLAAVSLEYRFPLFGQSVWGEVFVDSGQVYRRLERTPEYILQPLDPTNPAALPGGGTYDPTNPPGWNAGDPAPSGYSVYFQGASFPAWRTTAGLGLILKVGFPVKLEYAADVKRILGRPRTDLERETQLRSIIISAGFQF